MVVGRSRYAAEKKIKIGYTPLTAQLRAPIKKSIPWTWAGENHAFFRNVTLIIDPTFIPHRFGILDFRIWI